jgi:hypothetical protein
MKTSGGTIYALAEMIYGGAVQLLMRLHMHAFVCMYVGRYLYREMVVCMYIYIIDMLQQGPGVMLIHFFFLVTTKLLYTSSTQELAVAHYKISSQPNVGKHIQFVSTITAKI